nr:multidrug transporter [uncultured Blautia sp.]
MEGVYIEVSKSDWKLFRARIGDWQEAHRERLVKEYMDLLEGEENASDKFWKLEERIKKDKKHPGVMLELSKGNMIFDIVALINSGVITTADLADFSDELKESVDFLLHR